MDDYRAGSAHQPLVSFLPARPSHHYCRYALGDIHCSWISIRAINWPPLLPYPFSSYLPYVISLAWAIMDRLVAWRGVVSYPYLLAAFHHSLYITMMRSDVQCSDISTKSHHHHQSPICMQYNHHFWLSPSIIYCQCMHPSYVHPMYPMYPSLSSILPVAFACVRARFNMNEWMNPGTTSLRP